MTFFPIPGVLSTPVCEDVERGRFSPPIREVEFDLTEFQKDIPGYNAKLGGALHGH